MDLSTITMDRKAARQAFLDYRRAVRERHDAEDEQIMRGYRELARGSQLIHLTRTLEAGGRDEQGRPRLAIARADARWVRAHHDEGTWTFCSFGGGLPTWARRGGEPNHSTWNARHQWKAGGCRRVRSAKLRSRLRGWPYPQAMVPVVPAALRPAGKLGRFHILWEAEWQLAPPVDPALLRHIAGDLYAVVAVWDLSELERAVLSARAADLEGA